jgi:hypothetical protein
MRAVKNNRVSYVFSVTSHDSKSWERALNRVTISLNEGQARQFEEMFHKIHKKGF